MPYKLKRIYKIIGLLLKNKNLVTAKDSNGVTVLMYALLKKN